VAEQILNFFPLEDLPPRPAEPDTLEQKIERLKLVQKSLIIQKPRASDEVDESEGIRRPGE